MSLLDKVKTQAAQVAEKAQEAGKAGQAKLEEAQAKRKVDGMFRELGAAVYAERTGKTGADPTVIDRLVGEIKTFEAEHGAAGSTPGTGGGSVS
ncbi:MAG: hypothetical protein JO337_04290 [Acidimicrobiales bacterium]|nr:hypothetical protein [Acidimicrobiales bacterium]